MNETLLFEHMDFLKILRREKHSTIVLGSPDYIKTYPVKLQTKKNVEGVQPSKTVPVVDAVQYLAKNVPQEYIDADGYTNRDHFYATMHTQDPNFTVDSVVTVVVW